jgi:hypothetical protein
MIVRASLLSYPWFCSILSSESTVECQACVRHVSGTCSPQNIIVLSTYERQNHFCVVEYFLAPFIHVSYSEGGKVTPSIHAHFHNQDRLVDDKFVVDFGEIQDALLRVSVLVMIRGWVGLFLDIVQLPKLSTSNFEIVKRPEHSLDEQGLLVNNFQDEE